MAEVSADKILPLLSLAVGKSNGPFDNPLPQIVLLPYQSVSSVIFFCFILRTQLFTDQAPALLPLVGTVLKAGPAGLLVLAAGSAAAAAVTIFLIPDDSIASVALQTFAAIPLGAIVPGACVVGAGVLNKLK